MGTRKRSKRRGWVKLDMVMEYTLYESRGGIFGKRKGNQRDGKRQRGKGEESSNIVHFLM